jgi:hypothetical protein
MKRLMFVIFFFVSCASAQDVFFNEIRANDDGTDDAEFIELIGPAGFDLSGWTVRHINGTGGSVIFSFTFPENAVIPDAGIQDQSGREIGFVVLKNANHQVPNALYDWGNIGLQNGPDGLELLDAGGIRIQALTWNGTGDLTGGDPPWRNVGNDGNDDRSLCAPDSLSELYMADWEYIDPTPGVLNLNQTSGDVSLPVELISFTISSTDDYISLRWATASEVDNLGFIIRRSEIKDGPFNTIASYKTDESLRGAGNSSQLHHYTYDDLAVFSGSTYWYQLFDVDVNGHETLKGIRSAATRAPVSQPPGKSGSDSPGEFHLYQNYPNPFNPDTRIDIDIPDETIADLSVFDILGRKIITLLTGKISGRLYSIYWNGRDSKGNPVPSGLYIYILNTGDYYAGKRMLLIR